MNVSPFKAMNMEPSGQLRLSVVTPLHSVKHLYDEITTELEAIHASCGTGTVRLHDYIQAIEETCTAIHQLAERL